MDNTIRVFLTLNFLDNKLKNRNKVVICQFLLVNYLCEYGEFVIKEVGFEIRKIEVIAFIIRINDYFNSVRYFLEWN